MWVSILYKSCNKTSEFESFEDDMITSEEEVPSLSDEYGEEPFFTDDDKDGSKTPSESPIDYNELDKKIEASQSEESDQTQRKATPVKTTNSSNQSTDSGDLGGRYLVIAGSYILENNADVMVKKLVKMGYSNAEKVVFDLSQFYSVCAGRYDDYTKAVQVDSDLERRGIECYVHKKQ
jgi:hypothetical protein